MKAQERMTKARIGLILDEPFFGSLLMNLQSIEDGTVQTMCTNAIDLRWNPKFVETLDDAQIKAVLCHEVLHCALLHPFRKGERDHKKSNIAADYVVNGELEAYNEEARAKGRTPPFPLPKGALIDAQHKGKSFEEVYAGLGDDPKPEGGNPKPEGSGNGEGEGEGEGTGWGDFEDAPGESEAEQKEQEAGWKVAITQAAAIAKGQGKLPGSMARLVEEMLNPKVDWREALRQFVSAHARSDYSFSKPNRRYTGGGFILPSLHSQCLGAIAIIRDTSGSITPEIDSLFLAEINALVFQCNPEKVVLIDCDAAVQQVIEFGTGEEIKADMKGGGGTRFEPALEHLSEMPEQPICCIYLTDGEGSYPNQEPPFPVLWAMTGDRVAPFGTTIKL